MKALKSIILLFNTYLGSSIVLFSKARNYLKKHGIKKFVKKSVKIILGKHINYVAEVVTSPMNLGSTSNTWYYDRFPSLQPLKVFLVPNQSQRYRINLVTDSINSGSLYGGVATAIIFATLLAHKMNCNLRIITRTERAIPHNIRQVLTSNNIRFDNEVEFFFANIFSDSYQMDISERDIYITTSWWTTESTIKSISPKQIIYLLQEDERMFYPYGDDHYYCTNVLSKSSIRFIVNTKLLFDHFCQSGLNNIKNQGMYFEPSFVSHSYQNKSKISSKKNFFFYARPNNLRNLFYLGLEAIDVAIEKGVLKPDDWEIHFVGKDLGDLQHIKFDGYKPKLIENLSFPDYIDLIGSMDIGLSLMYTPHPSYPPLDLAACGAVVVTNKFGTKQNLNSYSDNIICKELLVEDLVDGLEEAIKIVSQQDDIRESNFKNNSLSKDWEASFKHILDNLNIVE